MSFVIYLPYLITIGSDNTTVSYINQPRLSRQCRDISHQRNAESTAVTGAIVTVTNTSSENVNGLFNDDDFPPLAVDTDAHDDEQKQNDEWTDEDDNENVSSSSTDCDESTNKRRRSNKAAVSEAKKICADQCSPNTAHVDVVDTPSRGKSVSFKIKNAKACNSFYNRK